MHIYGASLVSQMVKNLPAILETQVQSLGQKDPLDEGMVTHSMPHTLTVCFKYVFEISRSPRSIRKNSYTSFAKNNILKTKICLPLLPLSILTNYILPGRPYIF